MERQPEDFDTVVVGGGLVGLATARELLIRDPGRGLAVVEKEDGIAHHQSGRNSGVIHSGLYYKPGSLKARLCVEGGELLTDYCDEHGIGYRRIGKLVVARTEAELPRLHDLHLRGVANGVPGLRLLDRREIAEIEPNVTGLQALHSPGTGIIDYREVAAGLAADIRALGGRILTGRAVTGLARRNGRWVVRTPAGRLTTWSLITCAGLQADVLARMTGASRDPQIVPFRGDFWRLPAERQDLVRGLVYPVPDPAFPFLGVHFTPRMDGSVWLGPNAVLAFAREGYRFSDVRGRELARMMGWPGLHRLARRYWRTGLGEVRRAASRRALAAELRTYVPALRREDLLPGPAGVRAQALSRDGKLVDDFVFAHEDGVLHVRNAPSPAATSCLAIARRIVDQFGVQARNALAEAVG